MLSGGRPLCRGAESVGFRVRQRQLPLGSLLAQILVLAELFPPEKIGGSPNPQCLPAGADLELGSLQM